jgi:glycosyltransferase involved in cell wall biosynthesis
LDIWLVSPAWQRFDVTYLVLHQRRWLCDELAKVGLTANAVIVADDENLEIAEHFGFPTVELDNTDLGARFNAGYQYAAGEGADVFCHIGSDDWVHPDLFKILTTVDLEEDTPPPMPAVGEAVVWRRSPAIVGHRRILLANLETGRSVRCFVPTKHGCIPWLIPRKALEREAFAPIEPGLSRGIDGALVRGMSARPTWIFQNGPDEWCVDWKTSSNLTAYKELSYSIGMEEEREPWDSLTEFYPVHLVEEAMSLAVSGGPRPIP